MLFLVVFLLAGANAAAFYSNSSSTTSTSTSQTMTLTSGQTGPSPYSDPYFRNPFDILVLNYIPVANGTDPLNTMNPAVSEMQSEYRYCSTLWDSDVSVWAKTAYYSQGVTTTSSAVSSALPAATAIGTIPSNGTEAAEVVGVDELADPKTYTQTLSGAQRVFTWTASEPCCKACDIYGGNVEVFYWPTATQSPPISTLVDSKGFTFTSPSVYVAFQSVQASNLCGNIGLRNNAPTLAFNPGELSTSEGFFYDTAKYSMTPITPYPAQYTRANWGDVTKCGWTTTTFWQLRGEQTKYSDFAAVSSAAVSYSAEYSSQFEINAASIASHLRVSEIVEQYTVSHDPCLPTVTIPSSRFTLTNKDTGQLTYCGGEFGFYDPPYALSRGTGFSTGGAATTTTAAAQANEPVAVGTPTPTVQPGSSPVPTTATETGLLPSAPESIYALPSGTKGISAVNGAATPQAQVNNPPAQADTPVENDPTTTSSTNTPVAVNNPPAVKNTPASLSSNDPVAVNNPATPVTSTPAAPNIQPATTTTSNPIILTPVPQVAPTTQPPGQITIDSSIITANPSSAFVIGSQTLTAGGQVTQADSVYSLATDGGALVAAGSSTQIIADPTVPATAPAKITVDGSTITANPSSAFVIATQTLTRGGQITHSNTVYSLATNGASLVVAASSTQHIAVPSPPSTPPAYIVGSQTLVPGAVATISESVISLQADGSSVVVAGSTAALSQYLAVPTSVIVGGQTQDLSAYLAGVTGLASLVIGGKTQALSLIQETSSGAQPSVVIGGSQTVPLTQFLASATGDASVVVGSKTQALSSYIAAVTGGATVVVGSKTETLTSLLGQASGGGGIANIIASIGGFTSASPKTTSSVQVGTNGTGTPFLGSAVSLDRNIWSVICMASLGILGTLIL